MDGINNILWIKSWDSTFYHSTTLSPTKENCLIAAPKDLNCFFFHWINPMNGCSHYEPNVTDLHTHSYGLNDLKRSFNFKNNLAG